MLPTVITFIVIFQFWYFISIIYYHRHLAHQSIKFSPAMVAIIKTMRWLVQWQGYALYYDRRWAATHIKHHQNSDISGKDPYMINIEKSPFAGIPGVTDEEMFALTKNNKNIKETKLDYFFNKYPYGFIITILVCYSIWGLPGILLSWLLSFSIGPTATAFNYIAHRWPGHINHKPTDQARNVPYLTPLYLGEELHGNHHRWPGRANFGVRWWEIDIAYYFLVLLNWFGLVKFQGETKFLSKKKLKLRLIPFGEIKE